jgi:DNA polymerase-3 subunit gamma/tau
MTRVARDVLHQLRSLVVAKVCAESSGSDGPSLRQLLDLADEETRDVTALASRAETDDLSRLFQGFSRAFDEIVRSGQPRMALEMALVRLARRPPLLPLDELMSRVGELERRLEGAPPPGTPRGGGGGGPPARGVRMTAHSAASPALAVEPAPTRAARALAPPSASLSLVSSPASDVLLAPSTAPGAVSIVDRAPPNPQAVYPVATPTEPVGVAPPVADVDPWRAILERVRLVRPALASVLEHAAILEVTAARIAIAFGPGAAFLAARAGEPESLEVLTREARAYFGDRTQVVLDRSVNPMPHARTVASVDADVRSAELAKARAAIEGHAVVQDAIRIFGAKIRDVKLPNGER